MRIILSKAAYTHDAVQCTGWLITMTGTKLGQTQWQLTVALQALVKHLNVTRAVHWLHRVGALFRLGHKHVFSVVIPVAGFLPQRTVNHLRGFDLFIARIQLHFTHVLLKRLIDGPAIRMPEHHARCFFLQVEKIQLLTQFTVVTFFRFFDAGDVRLQIFLVVPGGTVDTLQLRVLGITTPIRTGDTLQFEHAHNAGVWYVWATTHVDVFFVVIQTNGGFTLLDQIVDQCYFVVFFTTGKDLTCFRNRRHLFDDVVIFLDQLFYALLNRGQIFWREWALVINVVIETVFNHRADGHLGRWVQLFNRMANEVGKRVTDNFQTFQVAAGDQRNLGVVCDQFTGVHQLAIDATADGGFGQTRTDVFGNLHQGYGVIKFAFGTIRKGNNRHSRSLSVVAPTTGHMKNSGCTENRTDKKEAILYRPQPRV